MDVKAREIFIGQNGAITKREHTTNEEKSDRWGYPCKLVSIINPAVIFNCNDEVFMTERAAMKDHGESNGAYFVQQRKFRQDNFSYTTVAAVTVVEALKEHTQAMKKQTQVALEAAKVEFRKAGQGLHL